MATLCFSLLAFLLCSIRSAIGGDIIHRDHLAPSPKQPGCDNNFVLVKVQTWVDGIQGKEFVGAGAQFGKSMEAQEKPATHSKLALADPPHCCTPPTNKLSGEVILVHRGNCSFTRKAAVAEASGASAVLVANVKNELYKMGCDTNEKEINISITVVMLALHAGSNLEHLLKNSSVASVQVQLYSPRRPSLDPAEVFLWLMAVGTIVCASYWSAWSARESDIELDKLLKDASDYADTEEKGSSDIVDIGITSILLFIVTASCFLVVLYKFMSDLFVEVLVVLFSIGGVQGLQTCLVALLYRWFRNVGDSYIRVPFIGAVSHLTLAVSPFCLAFASVWAVYRNISFAWIGQDILGMSLMISVLQIVRVPNLKVGPILLSCAFLYDAFWVFVSKTLFHESVMIVVARDHRSGGIPMLLKFPRMLDRWGGYSIVGFGDILLSGLVLAFSLRYDWLCQKNLRAGYFLWAVVAYGLGLFSTYLALNFMDGHGQPALLYIVPLTLGTLLTLARSSGDLDVLWTRGEPQKICPHIRSS